MNELITAPLIGEAPSAPEINEAGRRAKSELLLRCEMIVDVVDEKSRDLAIDIARDIKTHIGAVEASYKEVSGPFHRMWQALGEVKKKHLADLDAELKRLNLKAGAFEERRREEIRREQERIAAEERRIERERLTALAESQRAEEEARKAALVGTAEISPREKAQLLARQLEIDSRDEELEKRKLEARQASLELAAAATMKPSGATLRTVISIEVVDIHELHAFNRAFVRMEPDLAAIKYYIESKVAAGEEHPRVPGIMYTRGAAFSARSR